MTIQAGEFHGGDRYMIQPTRSGARDIGALTNNPADLAFSSPVRADSTYGNQGSGSVVAGAVFDEASPSFAVKGTLTPPLLIRFTSETDVRSARQQRSVRAALACNRRCAICRTYREFRTPCCPAHSDKRVSAATVETYNGSSRVRGRRLGSQPVGNGYDSQQVRIANTDANGFTQGTQTYQLVAGSTARDIATALSGMTRCFCFGDDHGQHHVDRRQRRRRAAGAGDQRSSASAGRT